jgi:hypothetical protein
MIKTNLDRMSTQVLIPVFPAPEDPSWMLRKYAGKRLNAEDLNDFYRWEHD